MHRAHKIRLQPTAEQAVYFAKACGTARFAYNWALAEWQKRYEAHKLDKSLPQPNEAALRKALNEVKAEQFPWIAEVTKTAPQQAIKNLGTAYANAFRRIKAGKKSGRGYGFPQFKKKGVRDSFRADNGPANASASSVEVDGRRVKLPRCGWTRMREELRFSGRVISATVSKLADGWYVTLLVDTEERLERITDCGAVGVDLGVASLAALSTGEIVPALKPHRAESARLRRLSRSLSRKKKGSANRRKARAKLARLHLRIANVRKDVLHNLTRRLATEFSVVAIEDLHVAGMLRNRHLARSIADAGFAEFRRQLEYKMAMTGGSVAVVDRFFPSSKTCSECGVIHQGLTLSMRQWRCEDCGAEHHRDLNAAKNILAASCAVTACGEVGSGAARKCGVKPASAKQEAEHGTFVHA